MYRVFLLLVSVLMKLLLQAGARGKSVSLANLQNILSSDQSGTSLNTSRSIRIHNFKVGSIRFSILITKATAMILTFRYSTQCTEAACLNITSRQRLRISHSSSHVPSIKLFCVSLSLAILLHAYALPISQFLISNKMRENQTLKRISRSGTVK